MKRLSRVLIAVLVISMVLGCVGCNTHKETSGEGLTAIRGEHLVKDGTSEYKIVIPDDASSLIQIAVSEFNKFFSEATGVSLPVVSDKDIKDKDKFISIGETTLLQNTDITYEYEELGRDGYKIITKDDDLYLIGGAEYGSLYAVYELLEYLVEYEFLAEDCYTLAKGITELPLYEFKLTDIPDIDIRMASDGVVERDTHTLYRMRVRPYIENFISVGGLWAHNSLEYVQDSPDANTKWYNDAKNQLCYTAHGDEAEYEKMLNASFETLKKELMSTLEKDSVTFTIEDNSDTCDCKACMAMVQKYGALSSTIILFLNDLNAMVRDWFETEEGIPYARDLKIVFFAYNLYEAPPVTYNEETGKYEANEGIKLDEGVYCQLCPIKMDYYRPITDETNKEYYDNVRGWADFVEGKLYLWYYTTNFRSYFVPYDCFDCFADNYRLAAECNAYYIFDQRQVEERNVVTGWSALKSYLCSQLAWDSSQDVTELTNKFFDAYFGPASSEMREIFEQLRVLTNYNIENNELGGHPSIYLLIGTEEYWPKDILKKWLDCYAEAEDKIMTLKEKNPELYEMYSDHIKGEKLSALYLFIECYSYNTSTELLDAYKAEFKEIADSFGSKWYAEDVGISELYDKWGID